MTFYHTVIKGEGGVVKYNTIDASSPIVAMNRANDEWFRSGGDDVAKRAIYRFQNEDPQYMYQWAPPGTFEDRENLIV